MFYCKRFDIIKFGTIKQGAYSYRITEWLKLEETSGGHLVQPPLLKQDHLEPVVQDHVQTAF